MAVTIMGPFGELLELHTRMEAPLTAAVLTNDSLFWERYLYRCLDSSPLNRQILLRALQEDPIAAGRILTDDEIVEHFARRLALGTLAALRSEAQTHLRGEGIRLVPRGPRTQLDEHEQEPTQTRVKVRDWRIECEHHANTPMLSPCSDPDGLALVRQVIQKGSSIQVVPTRGESKDKVKLWWKDEPLGSLPSSLTVRSSGRPDAEMRMESGGGDTGTFAFDAEYKGELDISRFYTPSFWRHYMEKTQYSIGGGPTPINIEVFNPRRFRFEFALPPLAGFRDGVKYEAESTNPTNLVKPKNLTTKFEHEETSWAPSSLKMTTTRTATHPDPEFKPSESAMAFGSNFFFRDGVHTDFGIFTAIGKLLKFSETIREIVKAIKKFKDYAPQIGWYIDFSVQLFQGTLACEWYWKEYTDNRVYQYIDVNVAMKLLAIKFEFGLGVGAFSFKLQIFAELSGEIGVEASMKRISPDGAPGFTFPAFTGKIAGALGARFEAGIFFKFEAKAETALEMQVALGINQRNSPVTFDVQARWSGIQCTASGSVGPWGIGGNRTWRSTLVPPSAWAGLQFPKEEEYKPPFLSRDRIANVLEEVITDGWNVRVIKSSGRWFGVGDRHWSPREIADAIAAKIDADATVDRATDSIDGLAHRARGDLDRIGTRFGRDYVEEADFLAYLDGQFRDRLRDAASPELLLMKANGH